MIADPGDDDLDLNLSNMEAGLRLLSFLHDRTGPDERASVQPGEAFLLEALQNEAAMARSAYDRCRQAARTSPGGPGAS